MYYVVLLCSNMSCTIGQSSHVGLTAKQYDIHLKEHIKGQAMYRVVFLNQHYTKYKI